jgi:glycosyltransferase involved in cell wall biosynthesis
MKAAFVYAQPRESLREMIDRGEAPDTGLLGQNHLATFGVHADVRDSILRRRHRAGGVMHRLTWTCRELTIPLELRQYDTILTTIGPTLSLASRALRCPPVMLFNMAICQSLRRSNGPRRRMLAAGVRAAGAVICFAEAQRESLIELAGADGARIHTMGLGVDERFLATDAPPPPGGTVLAVGRDLGRDYRTFAAAISAIETRVVLVTSTRNIADVQLPENVELRLDVSPVELRTLYEQSACVVVPTRKEGFAFGADCSGQTVVLDAFAMSRPVVTSERSTLRGYVDHERNGLIVPAEDPSALREAVERVLGDTALAADLGRQGRAEVEERFTTRGLAGNVAGVLATMLAELDEP